MKLKIDKTSQKLRGRMFSVTDIRTIQRLTKKYFSKGRTYISLEVCKALNWKQPNGWLKDRACRDVLSILAGNGFLTLPPSKTNHTNKVRRPKKSKIFHIDTTPIERLDFKDLRFEFVKGSSNELLWNFLVNQYHYLGFTVFVGRSLKYLIYSCDRIVAAMGWCDPAWSIGSRDSFFSDIGMSLQDIRLRGINNGRFLIMPWVKIPNLASHILSRANKIIKNDWESFYSIKPLYLETFVDPQRFSGTCYKAANWLCLGHSKGFRKIGTYHKNNQSPKIVYIYCLDRNTSFHLRKYVEGLNNDLSN
jgi:hypothetical protein